MLCEKNMRMLEDEIRELEEKQLTWQTCERLAMLYSLRDHMKHECKEEKMHMHHLTHEQAVKWVEGMESDDPTATHGGKWTMEQVKPIAVKYGVPTEGDKFAEYWAVMNAMYSDYYGVAKKYGVLNPDFFADMAMAFISDRDAVKDKTARYYECIVEH